MGKCRGGGRWAGERKGKCGEFLTSKLLSCLFVRTAERRLHILCVE